MRSDDPVGDALDAAMYELIRATTLSTQERIAEALDGMFCEIVVSPMHVGDLVRSLDLTANLPPTTRAVGAPDA